MEGRHRVAWCTVGIAVQVAQHSTQCMHRESCKVHTMTWRTLPAEHRLPVCCCCAGSAGSAGNGQ